MHHEEGCEVMFMNRTYEITDVRAYPSFISIGLKRKTPKQILFDEGDETHGIEGDKLILVERDGVRYEVEDKHRDRFDAVLDSI
jgi:hypothetical protein